MTDKLLVKRELLERLTAYMRQRVCPAPSGKVATELHADLTAALAAPRQAAGEGLQVVGVRVISEGFGSYIADSAMGIGALYPGDVREPLCRLSDAQRAIAELRQECERLRGECARLESKYERDVWGLNNEGDPIGGDHPSGFANDLLRVTIERDTLRQQLADSDAALRESRANDQAAMGHLADMRQQLAERDAQISSMRAEVTQFIDTHWRPVAEQRDKLAGLLREAAQIIDRLKGDPVAAGEVLGDIDAALAEVKPCPESPHPATT